MGDWDFWIFDLVELIFNPCGEFRLSREGSVSQIHSPYLQADTPGIFSDLLRSVQMLKRVWGAGSYCTYSVPGKTTNLVPEFAVEELPLRRTVALVPEFGVKNLPLGRTLW